MQKHVQKTNEQKNLQKCKRDVISVTSDVLRMELLLF